MSLDNESLQVCCVKTRDPPSVFLTKLGKISFLVHVLGFFGAILPFLINNLNSNNIPGFLGFLGVPTIVVTCVGAASSILIIDSSQQCCAIQTRLCFAATLACVAATFHIIFAFFEVIIFWIGGLTGTFDAIAGLLLIKNVANISFEILIAASAIEAQKHLTG